MCDLENKQLFNYYLENQFPNIHTVTITLSSSFKTFELANSSCHGYNLKILWRVERRKRGVSDGFSTLSDLHQASDDDGDESDDFGVGEEVLDPGAPLHIGTVHKGQ